LFKDYVPDEDEIPVAGLRTTGAVLVGKTNVPEFALRGYTANPLYGVTRNPWNPALTPGGSSGGAVAAVAAGMVPLALATDGGGSIRRPAAHTGLVGLKPSIGRIRRGGGFPQLMFDCEVVGPIARTVADVAMMFRFLANDPDEPHAPPERARILFVERFGDAPIDPDIVERCRDAATRLETLGHEVTYSNLPFSIDAAVTAWQALAPAGLAHLARSEPRFFECASRDFIDQAQAGKALAATDYLQLIETLFTFRNVIARAFEDVDIIMTPATAAQPWPAEEAYPPVIDGQRVGPRGHAVFTAWINACGHPAIAIPSEPDERAMPVGFQLVGPMRGDEMLLRIGQEYEQVYPFAERWPPCLD
jgi:aspartyl-tRNA(Asn)/glutamyl-tRNA(Gln) amidotransferase subunit A